MSAKYKVTFYCDAVDCQANQTFLLTSGEQVAQTQTPRGVQPVMTVLTKYMGWSAEFARPAARLKPSKIVTYCPRHA